MPDASEAGGRRRRILTAFYGPHDLRLPVALESERWEQVAGQKEGRKVPTNEQLRELEAPLSSKEQELALGRRVTMGAAEGRGNGEGQGEAAARVEWIDTFPFPQPVPLTPLDSLVEGANNKARL
jgi:hypothetical protein